MHYIETCYTGKRGKWNQIFNLLFQVQFGWLLFAVGQKESPHQLWPSHKHKTFWTESVAKQYVDMSN